jgi:hypothetical protein
MYLGRVSRNQETPQPCIHGRRLMLLDDDPVVVAGCENCRVEWEPAGDGLDLFSYAVDDDAIQAERLAQEWLDAKALRQDPREAEELAVTNYQATWGELYGELSDRAWELFRAWRDALKTE